MPLTPCIARKELNILAASVARCDAVLAHLNEHGAGATAKDRLREMMMNDDILKRYAKEDEEPDISYAKVKGDVAYWEHVERSATTALRVRVIAAGGKIASMTVLPVLLIVITAMAGKTVGLDLQASEFQEQRLFELKLDRVKAGQDLADKLYGAVFGTVRMYQAEEQKYFGRYIRAVDNAKQHNDNAEEIGRKWLSDHPTIPWDPGTEIESHYHLLNQLRSHAVGLPIVIDDASMRADEALKQWVECVRAPASRRASSGKTCDINRKPFVDLVTAYGGGIEAMINDAASRKRRGAWAVISDGNEINSTDDRSEPDAASPPARPTGSVRRGNEK